MKFMDEGVRFEDARVVIIPVPYESTTTYLTGTCKGPSAIISGSLELENPERWDETPPLFHTLPPIRFSSLLPARAVETIAEVVKDVYSENKKALLLGGEHTITLGGIKKLSEDTTNIICIDAHLDFYSEYNDEKISHATVGYRISEKFGLIHAGARVFSNEEYERANKSCIAVFPGKTIFKENVEETFKRLLKENVYLSIDLDVIDPSEGISVSNPAPPPGWTIEELKTFLHYIFTGFNVVGTDLVEFRPSGNGSEVIVADLVKYIINLLLS